MATSFTVSEIVADIATLTGSPTFTSLTRVTDTQVTYWLAQAVRALSALFRQHHCDDRELVQSTTLNTSAGIGFVSLPTNTGEVQAVIWARGTNDYVLLKSATQSDLVERDTGGWESTEPVYRLQGETITFYPTPTKVHSVEVLYTNHYTTPLGATVSMRVDSDKWLALDVACNVAIAKKQSDAPFQQRKALLENDLLSPDRGKDPNAVLTIRDTRAESAISLYRSRWGG